MPDELRRLLAAWGEHDERTGEYRHRPLAIAPDAVLSREGFRRVPFFTRPQGLTARCERHEYQVPEERVGRLVWAFYQERDGLARFDAWRIEHAQSTRDLMVCTHRAVDAACAEFGVPLYRQLRDAHAAIDGMALLTRDAKRYHT